MQALKQMQSFGAQNLGNLAWAMATLGPSKESEVTLFEAVWG